LRTLIKNKLQYFIVFLISPGPFNQLRVQYLLPSVEALDISASGQTFRDFLPVLAIVMVDSVKEMQVLINGPVTLC